MQDVKPSTFYRKSPERQTFTPGRFSVLIFIEVETKPGPKGRWKD
jgi:hypothetical protein